jgi:hybrid cluster-associated redox disulfide protein
MAEEPKITKDMTIGDVIEKHPDCATVMMESGLHCIGCHVATHESIEQGSQAHGMSDEDIDKMVVKMNEAIEKKD